MAAPGFTVLVSSSHSARELTNEHSGDMCCKTCLFHECVIDAFAPAAALLQVSFSLDSAGNRMCVGKPVIGMNDDERSDNFLPSICLSHCPLCPCRHLHSAQHETTLQRMLLAAADSPRSFRFGVCVLVCDSLDRVLLTKRRADSRIFPGIWVLPGGHLDEGETFWQTGVREVCEETGVLLDVRAVRPLAMWESVYPRVLEQGEPRAHHLVLFLTARVDTAASLGDDGLTLQQSEVAAGHWFTRDEVTSFLALEQSKFPVFAFPASNEPMCLVRSVRAQRPDGTTEEYCLEAEDLGLGHRYALQTLYGLLGSS
eukprot:gnl/Spiro4/21819_TR10702_c0_g1_i1.p1 gnl/Spiro4/21819_TR10702_c0_g1~~gnl/Spiro4/21819_TR10702_c0_g1_i1.p1  ORF type:complete len:322 (+),score=56.24 gnl/Spiro4/21819_TR10702_c0_g1_i1:30-968(+)